VLASHPAVYGAGELMTLPDLIRARLPADGDFVRFLRELSDGEAAEMAQAYLDDLTRRDADARFVTDKLPNNFLNVGLIRRLFPGALILNTQRHPLDAGWSIYVQKFGADLVFDHDLGDIGHYIREYDRLMSFWQRWDPSILPLRYEDLVDDMEAVIMPVLKRLGLGWDPAMSRFFETDRAVHTASRLQVRRPIYKSSVARWRRFEDKLGPMRAQLGDLPERYERERQAKGDTRDEPL
jgi:hypothetical protein